MSGYRYQNKMIMRSYNFVYLSYQHSVFVYFNFMHITLKTYTIYKGIRAV